MSEVVNIKKSVLDSTEDSALKRMIDRNFSEEDWEDVSRLYNELNNSNGEEIRKFGDSITSDTNTKSTALLQSKIKSIVAGEDLLELKKSFESVIENKKDLRKEKEGKKGILALIGKFISDSKEKVSDEIDYNTNSGQFLEDIRSRIDNLTAGVLDLQKKYEDVNYDNLMETKEVMKYLASLNFAIKNQYIKGKEMTKENGYLIEEITKESNKLNSFLSRRRMLEDHLVILETSAESISSNMKNSNLVLEMLDTRSSQVRDQWSKQLLQQENANYVKGTLSIIEDIDTITNLLTVENVEMSRDIEHMTAEKLANGVLTPETVEKVISLNEDKITGKDKIMLDGINKNKKKVNLLEQYRNKDIKGKGISLETNQLLEDRDKVVKDNK